MPKHHKAPDDGKNRWRKSFAQGRFFLECGQSSIHGDSTYEVVTGEAQSFGFYASTGQGASEGGGPGTGKAVLFTPGLSMEVLGEGLKVRDAGDISMLPAKIIKCKRGDIYIEAENGDITLRGRNITLDAFGGGQDGQLNVKATRVATVDSPDIRLQGEKILIKSDNTCNIISKGFLELKSGFTLSASFADESFGTMAQVLKAATTINPPALK